MPITNGNKVQIHLPNWQQLRFSPIASSSISTTCYAENSSLSVSAGRYIYYLASATEFLAYDTFTDTYVKLSSPPIAPTAPSCMQHLGTFGFGGRVLSSTSTTINASAYSGEALKGEELQIISGVGKGQRRLIKNVSSPVVVDAGQVQSLNASSVTDTSKSWAINQFAGMQFRVVQGAGAGQVRRILHNSANTLFFSVPFNVIGANYSTPAPFNPSLSIISPNRSRFVIEYSTLTVDSPWQTQPDESSVFRTSTGAIVLFNTSTAAPFHTIQLYDVVSDTWYLRFCPTGLFTSAFTDATIEHSCEEGSIWALGVATNGSDTSLSDITKSYITNEFVGKWIRIYSGTGEGQLRQISSNTTTTIEWTTPGVTLDSTSRYIISGFDAGLATSGTSSTLTDSSKSWTTNQWKNYRLVITEGTGKGQERLILSNTSTSITTVTSFSVSLDSTSIYELQGSDTSFILPSGIAGVLQYSFSGSHMTPGYILDSGVVNTGTSTFGDFLPNGMSGMFGTGTTKTVTTQQPHGYKTGWVISHAGDTGASAIQNNIAAPITVLNVTQYTFEAPGSFAGAIFTDQSTTTLKDSSKNWTVNQWAGHLCYFYQSTVTTQTLGDVSGGAIEILSNTSNTLTFKSPIISVLPNTSTRYAICSASILGSVVSGIATGAGQSTTSIQDTTKSWPSNYWQGNYVRITAGSGQSFESQITTNSVDTLIFNPAITGITDGVSSYAILGTSPKSSGVKAFWPSKCNTVNNQGRYLYLPTGGNSPLWNRLDLTSNTWEIIPTVPRTEALNTGSMFAYDGGDRIYFMKHLTNRLYYLDLSTYEIHGAGMAPFAPGTTAISGNRLEVYETADRIKYLWLNRPLFQDCMRVMLFW